MKRVYTLLSLLLLCSISVLADDVTINATNFPDENFRNWVLAQDYGQDGKLTEEEVKSVYTIDIQDKGISDLTGIEYFTALMGLNCYSNQLISLDVSKNTELVSLVCLSNKLTSLYVSNNKNLQTLRCGWNQLTSLDVSNNIKLSNLQCQNNQLTSLDVSKNVNLDVFSCGDNQLTSLDVSNNTALRSFYCNNNELTSLDVSRNADLNKFECNDNQLSSLDVSNNTALTRLDCHNNQLTSLDVSKNTALEEFWCNNNQLTSLDVSKSMALRIFQCQNNQLTSLDVSKSTALEYFWCNDNQLTSLDVSNNTALKYLECGYNQLTSLDVSNNTALESLFSYFNQLTSLDVSKNTALTKLKCQNNQLTSLDVSNNTALQLFLCNRNQINETEMEKLVESLPQVSKGEFLVKTLKDDKEKNVITKAQVAAAKEKGWTVYAFDPISDNTYRQVAYEGSDPSEPQSDIKKTTVDGVEWTYTIVSESDKTCMLGGSTTGDNGTVVYYPAIDANTTGNVTIPGTLDGYTVVTIGKEAFRGCKIEAVTIPAEVTYIDDNAFADCSNLVKVICNGQPYDISESAFEGLYSQATAYFPEDCKEGFLSKKGWSKFSKMMEIGVEERLPDIKAMVEDIMYKFYKINQELEEKATQSDAPELYDQAQKLAQYLDYLRYKVETVSTMRELREIEAMQLDIREELYIFQEKVSSFTPLTPLTSSTTTFEDLLNSESRLHGSVIGNILFNVGDGDGGYNDQEGCIEITKTTANDTMAELEFKSIYGDVFQGQFAGIVLQVPKGKGTLKIDAQTSGYMMIVVKIGHAEPIGKTVDGRLWIDYGYDLEEDSYVYIYAGIRSTTSNAKGIRKAKEDENNVLKIYGITLEESSTGIEEVVGESESNNVYSLSGQKVRSQAKDLKGLPAGVYIVGGKKVFVK